MTIDALITLAAGILAMVGLFGILLAAAAPRLPARQRVFRTGSVAMGLAGVVLLLGGLMGHADMGQMVGGFMLIVFGTAIGLPKTVPDDTPAGTAPTH